MFPVALVAKDSRYGIGDEPARMPVATAALALFERAERDGLADANLTSVATLF